MRSILSELPLSTAFLLHAPVPGERVFVAIQLVKVKLQFQDVEVGACTVVDYGQNRIAEQFLSDDSKAPRDLLRRGQCRKVEQRCKTRIVGEVVLVLGAGILCKFRGFPGII